MYRACSSQMQWTDHWIYLSALPLELDIIVASLVEFQTHTSLSLSLDYSRNFFTLMARPASWASSQVSKGSIRARFQTSLHDASSIVGCSCMQQASASAFLSHDPIVCCTHQYKNGAIGIQSDGMHRWRLSACWSLLTSVPSFKLS